MKDGARRLFFALWPDAATRAGLSAWQARIGGECGGRPVAPENLHLTLKFLGAVPQSSLDELRVIAAQAVMPPIQLVLDRVGFWPRPAVVFAGADHVPPALAALAGYLDDAASGLGIAPERRRFRAHCTLFRKAARRPGAACEPLCWKIRGFVLAESLAGRDGVSYRVIGKWPPRSGNLAPGAVGACPDAS